MKTYKEFMVEIEKGSGMTKNGHPAFRNPNGELFKDRHGDLHIVSGGSRARPMSIAFNPRFAEVNSYGTFSPMIDKLVPWTKMVKKSMVKKFIRAIEMEIEFGRWFQGASDRFAADQAIKALKRMGK